MISLSMSFRNVWMQRRNEYLIFKNKIQKIYRNLLQIQAGSEMYIIIFQMAKKKQSNPANSKQKIQSQPQSTQNQSALDPQIANLIAPINKKFLLYTQFMTDLHHKRGINSPKELNQAFSHIIAQSELACRQILQQKALDCKQYLDKEAEAINQKLGQIENSEKEGNKSETEKEGDGSKETQEVKSSLRKQLETIQELAEECEKFEIQKKIVIE